MVEIKHMQIRLTINQWIKKGYGFEQILLDPGISSEWVEFLQSRIGKIWIKSKNGQLFTKWNQE